MNPAIQLPGVEGVVAAFPEETFELGELQPGQV